MSGQEEMTHISADGSVEMVDVSEKKPTVRVAEAGGTISLGSEVVRALRERALPKGDALAAARIAAIQAVKTAAIQIPLCHPVSIGGVRVDIQLGEVDVRVRCQVKGSERTGYEMEALSGVTAALLTVYDMCKALSREMEIGGVRLLHKSGGRSGEYRWQR